PLQTLHIPRERERDCTSPSSSFRLARFVFARGPYIRTLNARRGNMDPVGHRPRRAIVIALATAALAVVAIVSFYVGRPAQAASVVMVGAGAIAHCSTTTDEATAKLLDGISGTVFTLGDNVYNSGTTAEFKNCYGPTWGRHKA